MNSSSASIGSCSRYVRSCVAPDDEWVQQKPAFFMRAFGGFTLLQRTLINTVQLKTSAEH
jgi:hypothetical protein